MFILSTFLLKEEMQNELREMFPDETFSFYKGMENAKEHLGKSEILLTYGEDLTPELIEQAHQLKWIMVVSAGMEKMPFDAIDKRGILVTNARGIHKIPMAEYTISMMLQTYRQAKVLTEQEKSCVWNRKVNMQEIHGKTILIIGAGAIGGEIARLAKAFSMKTIGINRSGKAVEYVDKIVTLTKLDEVLPEADFVVNVLPSTKETTHILTENHFELMKETAVFINIGRGNVVSEQILIDALKQKKIAHAVLDVFETEPLPSDHIFWKLENVTVTPHLSGISKLYLPRAMEIFKENLKRYKQGETLFINQIDVKRGY